MKVRANVDVYVDSIYRKAGDVFDYFGGTDPVLVPVGDEPQVVEVAGAALPALPLPLVGLPKDPMTHVPETIMSQPSVSRVQLPPSVDGSDLLT